MREKSVRPECPTKLLSEVGCIEWVNGKWPLPAFAGSFNSRHT